MPFLTNPTDCTLTAGDSYRLADSRDIVFTAPAGFPTLVGSTIAFKVFSLDGTLIYTSAAGAVIDFNHASVSLSTSDTQWPIPNGAAERYRYSVLVTLADGDKTTLASGRLIATAGASTTSPTPATNSSSVTLPILESDVTNLPADLTAINAAVAAANTAITAANTAIAAMNTTIATLAPKAAPTLTGQAVAVDLRATGTIHTGYLIVDSPASFGDAVNVYGRATFNAQSVYGNDGSGAGGGAWHGDGGTIAGFSSITATAFTGNLTGNVTGNASGITGGIAESQVTGLVTDLAGKVDASATQAANRVFAGPATGSPAAPTFRAAVKADQVATTAYTDAANTFSAAPQAFGGAGQYGTATTIRASTVAKWIDPDFSNYVINVGLDGSGKQYFQSGYSGTRLLDLDLINDRLSTNCPFTYALPTAAPTVANSRIQWWIDETTGNLKAAAKQSNGTARNFTIAHD